MKKQSVVILSKLLSNLSVLQQKTKNYHWHVRGENFSELHALFGEQYKELDEEQDEIAERIRMLGEASPATFKDFLSLASLTEDITSFMASNVMISNLLKDHQFIIESVHSGLTELEGSRDEGSKDLLTNILRAHEKISWILGSYLGI